MFGTTAQLAAAGVSNAGRRRLPVRPMVALLYLKHAYNESDESLVGASNPSLAYCIDADPLVHRRHGAEHRSVGTGGFLPSMRQCE